MTFMDAVYRVVGVLSIALQADVTKERPDNYLSLQHRRSPGSQGSIEDDRYMIAWNDDNGPHVAGLA